MADGTLKASFRLKVRRPKRMRRRIRLMIQEGLSLDEIAEHMVEESVKDTVIIKVPGSKS